MNRNEPEARQLSHTFRGVQHREIGLRAVAAAVLYQGGSAERAIWPESAAEAVAATPSRDHGV